MYIGLNSVKEEACLPQTDDPNGRTYSGDSVVAVSYSGKHCGLLPLSRNSYWIYEDSLFNNGVFVKKQYDTLQFAKTYQSPDGLLWWEINVSIGLPEKIYCNDSTIFTMEKRMFSSENIMDVKREFYLFDGDSIRYLAHFEDYAAIGTSKKLNETISTPAGDFTDCIWFDKNARSFRDDQVFFKPGFGVIKYIQRTAPPGSPYVALHQISTLIKFHIE